jgi:hypothetical protein
MKLLVLGATGGTGLQVVSQGIERGLTAQRPSIAAICEICPLVVKGQCSIGFQPVPKAI